MYVSLKAVTRLATGFAVLWHSVLGCCGEHGHAGTVRHNQFALSLAYAPPAANPTAADAALRRENDGAPVVSLHRPHCVCGHSHGATLPSVNAAFGEQPSGFPPERECPCACGESRCAFAATQAPPAPTLSTLNLAAWPPDWAASRRTAAPSAAAFMAFNEQSGDGLRSHLRLHILRI